jgi:hypothetical protein
MTNKIQTSNVQFKEGYWLVASKQDQDNLMLVFLGKTKFLATIDFDKNFPEEFADLDWYVERCLYIDTFGYPVWNDVRPDLQDFLS